MRRLVAALACRMQGSRLYGKPLQNLDVEKGISVLEHMVQLIQTIPAIDTIVLGIAEGPENASFIEYARVRRLAHIVGSERDVLSRLIHCARHAEATDVFRVTTESPYFYFELVDEAWRCHREAGNDVTTTDRLPEGCHFEIYTREALERSHRLGDDRHRSEFCSLYIREHRGDFQVEVLSIPMGLERLDLRLTIDYPEDLVLCRKVYAHLRSEAPRVPVSEIIAFIDRHPELQALVSPYVVGERLW